MEVWTGLVPKQVSKEGTITNCWIDNVSAPSELTFEVEVKGEKHYCTLNRIELVREVCEWANNIIKADKTP